MEENSIEISAKTEEEAVNIALEELGASRDQVEVEVLSHGKHGFLGLGGSEVVVRVTRIPPEDVMVAAREMGRQVLEDLLSLMNLEAKVEDGKPLPGEKMAVKFNVVGNDLGILIGRRGSTLYSLQFIAYLIVSHRLKAHVPLNVDVEGYKDRRYESLSNLAARMADSVMATGKPVSMEPMPANERRIIHLALRDHPGVVTQSLGFGEERKVTIRRK